MGTINIYNQIDNTHQTINGCGKLSELLPANCLNENTIYLKAGSRIDSDFYVDSDDIIFVRKTPKAISTVVAVVLGTATVVMAGWVLGSALTNIVDGMTKEMQEKAQRDAQNLAQQVQQFPFIKGANNKSALGQSVPFVMGSVYHTPYKMTDGFYTIEDGDLNKNEYGSKQFYNVMLNLGFGDQKIEDVLIGSDSILKNSAGITSGVHTFDTTSIFYDSNNASENKVEIRQSGSEFTTSQFLNKVISTSDGSQIKHDFGKDAEPLIRTLADYTKKVEVCIQFNGLREYDSEHSNWIKRKATVRAYWTNKENPSDSDWNQFYFDNMTDNTIELNTNKTVRFVARKEFSASQSYGKTIKIKLVKTTPALESNSNEDCYLVYYQSICYDNAKSSSSQLVSCKPVEEELVNKTTRIALRICSNDNVKDILNEIHCVVSGVARTWNGSAWSTEKSATRNPASWILEILTNNAHFHSKYSDNEIDLDSFGSLYSYCEDNGFHTDGILTSGIKKRDLLTDILSSVNSTLILNDEGLLEVVTDKKETTPVALLNAENISSITYSKDLSRKPDGLKVTFTNRNSWQIDTFYSYKESNHVHSQEDNLTELNLNYVTDYEHAYKVAQRRLRQTVLQPREIKVNVGLEGDYYPLYSTVMLQYTTFRQGLFSSVVTKLLKDEDENIVGVRVSDLVEMESNKSYGVIIQSVTDLGRKTFYKQVQTIAGSTKDLIFADAISSAESLLPEIDNPCSFGLLDSNGGFSKVTNTMKIVDIQPNGSEGYSLTLKDYNEDVYEYGDIPAYKSNITPPPKQTKEIPQYTRLEGERGQDGKSSFTYRGIIYSLSDVPEDVNVDDFFLIGQNFTERVMISTSDGALISAGTNKVLGYVYNYVKGTIYSYKEDGRLHLISNKNDYRYTIAQNDYITLTNKISPALESATVEKVYEETGIENLTNKEIIDSTKKTIKDDLIDADAIFTKQLTIKQNGSIQSENYYEGIRGFIINSNGNVEFNKGRFRGGLGSNYVQPITIFPSGSYYFQIPNERLYRIQILTIIEKAVLSWGYDSNTIWSGIISKKSNSYAPYQVYSITPFYSKTGVELSNDNGKVRVTVPTPSDTSSIQQIDYEYNLLNLKNE